mmetsp:Transcript_68419/g.160964  ORF Transcript_68419/g.160964 Transcript_68419/m.160964 type:complete len:301 (+) Transcript_68419:1441-2343(+)
MEVWGATSRDIPLMRVQVSLLDMVASGITGSLAGHHSGTSRQGIDHIRSTTDFYMSVSVEAIGASRGHVKRGPMNAVFCDGVAHGVLGSCADSVNHRRGGCCSSACSCCGWHAAINLEWQSMTIALLHLCITNVASGASDRGAKLPHLQILHSKLVARRVSRLNARVGLAAGNAIWQTIVITLCHFCGTVMCYGTVGLNIPVVQLSTCFCDHITLCASWGLAVDVLGTTMDSVRLLFSCTYLDLGVADVGGCVALGLYAKSGPPQALLINDIAKGVFWCDARTVDGRGCSCCGSSGCCDC